MPTVTNESAAGAGSKSASQATRRTEAVGVEIPVVIHASRNSASARESGKTLPVVHEESRTVIVFPQGAVVRLTAMVTTGELVVLTNQRTGADVLCRVASIKAQPGIQNYVDLEFTQRAPGFWGDCFPSERSSQPATNAAPSAPSSSAVVPSVLTMPPQTPPPILLTPTPQPVAPAHMTAPPAMLSTAPATSAESYSAPASQTFQAPVANAPASVLELSQTYSAPRTQEWTPRMEPQFRAAESTSGSNKMLLIAAAVIVLLGAAGGGYFLTRGNGTSTQAGVAQNAPLSQPVASTTAQSATPETSPSQTVPSSPAAAPAAPVVPAPVQTASAAVAPNPAVAARQAEPVAAGKERVQPAPIPAPPSAQEIRDAHTLGSVGKLSHPVAAKPTVATSAVAPPVLPANAGASALEANLLTGEQSAPLAPTATVIPPSLAGGRVQQPKLVSSTSPSYPATATAQRIQGDVVVDALVDANGKVTATKIVTGPPLLQQAAMLAVRSWKYEPGRLDGEPISTHIQVRITFRLP